MTGDEIGFSEISDVHRNERRSKVLTKLPPHFHQRSEKHLQNLRDQHHDAVQASGGPTAMMLWDQISKVDKRLKLIYELRERKITLAALDRMVGAQPPDNMTKREKALYEQLINTLASFRKGNEAATEKRPPREEMPEPGEPERSAQSTIAAPEPVAAEEISNHPDTAVVHVLEDIPEFAGLNADYELKKDDMVTLPSRFANVLSSRGLVRIVSG